MLDVREADLLQGAGTAAAILGVDLLEPFRGDPLQLLVTGAGLLGIEETGGALRGRATVKCRTRASSVVPTGAV
ncbi:hypothetical protein SGLAM104S_07099 [Streptomyces glaucescens]